MNSVLFHDIPDLSDYKTIWQLQEKMLKEIIDLKEEKITSPAGHLIFCEHQHVFTLGKFGKQENLLTDTAKLSNSGASFYHTDRGGDITYHGPGQLVGYPVFNLNAFNLGVKGFVHTIEQAIIDVLSAYGIIASRMNGATGVWIDPDIPLKARKICAIGIKVSRGVSMHGFALNINTDLSFFNLINPCGFTDKQVTSMNRELSEPVGFQKVKSELLGHLKNRFGFVS